MNGLAWIRATTADVKLRDPATALKLAQDASDQLRVSTPLYLDTLATAQAATGHYEQAVQSEQAAIAAAANLKNAEFQKKLEGRLKLYQADKTFVESPAPTTKP